ncbi:probable E3 ubiquitin-protein ligase MARCHF10 isoform X11 [Dasypus novemcinctus]|uniref:probable E3 ubiquitin-protein ligase MARCHF10 isoform X11 n=1 Tax=Dasypus novemcinctus TaxID=9361 RepID=UPI00265F3D3D|nr:probable E3 ubiquitin-protein ligase MARCHF10 isoform X11 [Dasypus novemcinctus]
MLHEASDRQKFVSDVQYLRDMQHKVDTEYQESGRRCSSLINFEACLRRQEHKRDLTDKKRDQFWVPETSFERSRVSSGSSSKQTQIVRMNLEQERHLSSSNRASVKSSVEEDPLSETRLSAKTSVVKCDSKLPAIDQTSVKQKHKSTMTPRKPEKAGPSKPSPGDSSEHPLFCVEYSPYCTVFALSPAEQSNPNYCCLLLPLVPPVSQAPQDPAPSYLPPISFPSFTNPPSSSPGPVPPSPAALCYFPISCPTPSEIPVLCLPGPRRPSKIYLVW